MVEYFKKHSPHEPFQRVHSATNDMWVHIGDPRSDELAVLTDEYKLDPNILRDVMDKNELPRREYSAGILYIFLRPAMRTRAGEVKTRPFLAAITKDAFITIATSRALSPEMVAQTSEGVQIRTANRASMLLLVINATIVGYEELTQHTGDYINTIRKKLRQHEVKNDDFVHFVTIEDNLNEYHVNLQDTLTVVKRLQENEHNIFAVRELEELNDIALYIKQLLTVVTSHAQTITSIRNAYSTIANNTLNQRMKALTALTVMISLPNVISGMYGMNIELPFQHQPWAYAAIMIVTVILVYTVYTIAKRFRIF